MPDINPQLLRKFFTNECTDAEYAQVMHWMQQTPEAEVSRTLEALGQHIADGTIRRNTQVDLPFEQIAPPLTKPKPGYRLRVAASIAAIIAAALVLYLWLPSARSPEQPYLTTTTASGQTAGVTLSDGSEIWLNAETTLWHPQQFATRTRTVALTGEAFFSVARDPQKPFIIRSGALETTVLGTSFNVSAYPQEDIRITVSTGRVQVALKNAGDQQAIYLTPGQQARLNRETGRLSVVEADGQQAAAWRQGVLHFDAVKLTKALLTLERQFGVHIYCTDTALLNTSIRTSYYQEDLKTILADLQFILDFDYTYVKDSITLSR